jgi:hypothetical protein
MLAPKRDETGQGRLVGSLHAKVLFPRHSHKDETVTQQEEENMVGRWLAGERTQEEAKRKAPPQVCFNPFPLHKTAPAAAAAHFTKTKLIKNEIDGQKRPQIVAC